MTTARRTLEEVRRLGMEVLARELGPVDFVRFLQLFETGRGNYTEERHQWLDGLDSETIYQSILQRRQEAQEAARTGADEESLEAEGDR